jgi:hemin uptake protein HemP
MESEGKSPERAHDHNASESAMVSMRVVESGDLLAEGNEVLIRHDGRIYRLRRTRLGKLILTA